MLLSLFFFFVGLFLLYYGAEYLVEGSSRLALSFGVRPLIIGMTIVAFATSMPELLVTVFAALRGSVDLAVGNVVGSNVANIGLILGSSALVAPLHVDRSLLRRELPIMLMASLLLWLFALDQHLGALEGAVLLSGLAAFIFYCLQCGRQGQIEPQQQLDEVRNEQQYRRRDILFILGGVIALALGAELLIKGASTIARAFGVSDLLIGLSVVAFGTSLPELAASVVSAMKGELELSVGNVIGSNIFNVLFVIGISSIIHPLPVNPQLHTFQFPVMILIGALLYPMLMRSKFVTRTHGVLFLASYLTFLVVSFL
ncbi:MAG: hypothetical protein C0624_10605 [Desulfuromonas sp.]|nr:MAG: hypothetical protein C0624_10605 [Desulfuromonas sp.]